METEAKFTVPNDATFKELREVERLGQYTRRDASVKYVQDRYLDTPNHRFYGQRFYVRLREPKGEGALLLTLKRLGGDVEGAIHSREEYQTEVPGLDIAAWPENETRRIAEEIANGESLTDLVTVEQTRLVSHLYDGERQVVEYSLDEVTIQTPHGPVKIYELEVELLPDGTIADLHILIRIFVDTYKLTPQTLSKFERAIALSTGDGEEEQGSAHSNALAPGEGQGVERTKESDAKPSKKAHIGMLSTDSVEVAGRKLLGAYFSSMLANEEGARSGKDPEAVHDMRVATRRMRATLRALDDHLAGPAVVEVRRGVRALTQALGEVRDLDVLLGHAKEFQAELSVDQRSDLDSLLDEWTDKRKRARKGLILLLNSREYARFRKRMKRYINDEAATLPPDKDEEVQPFQVRHVAGSVLWGRYEEVLAFETVMDAPTIEQLHELRIKGKYLRYTLECFRETLPSDATDLIGDVVEMQDQLGELHDADVAAGLVRSHIARRQKKGKKSSDEAVQAPAGLAAYLAEREAAARQIHASFFTIWSGLSSSKWRARLADAIAAL